MTQWHKQIFVIGLFCVSSCTCVLAQIKHELKTDLFSLLGNNINLTYECGIANKWGFEIENKYIFDEINFTTRTNFNSQFADTLYSFKQQYFELTVGSNYYFSHKKGSDSFFVGAFWINRFLTKWSEDYNDLWDAYYGGERSTNDETWLSSRLGVKSGYKWIIKNNFIIEPELGIDYDLRAQKLYDERAILWVPWINFGYRF